MSENDHTSMNRESSRSEDCTAQVAQQVLQMVVGSFMHQSNGKNKDAVFFFLVSHIIMDRSCSMN